jgi:hypothetical protein
VSTQGIPATITWIPVASELPDEDITVLMCNEEWDEQVEKGYLDRGEWYTNDGMCLDGHDGQGNPHKNFTPPTHWAHLPEAAPKP